MAGKLKYACVGAGGIAEWKHIPGYQSIEDVEIVAVSDPNLKAANRVAEKYKIPNVYEDYKDMLAKEKPDIISVCTPNYLHKPVTIEALSMGIHVHCEKPLAMNAKEVEEMIEARDKYGKVLMVGLNNRFRNESYFVKRCAEEGFFGEIYHAKCGWRRKRGIPGKGGWFTNKKMSGGGPLIDLGVHFLDLAMYFMGFPNPVAVTGAAYSKFADVECRNSWNYGSSGDGTYDVEDFAVGFVRLENGATIDLEFSWASNIEKEYNYFEILGTKGGACFKEDKLKLFTQMGDTLIDINPDVNYPKKAINEFEHFIDCIQNGTKPIAPPEEALKIMKIIDGIYKSSETKREVTF